MDRSVIVVGAGMAGLACATRLHAAGWQPCVLEAAGRPGGRVGSVRHPSGHLIDRGFQVLFSAYPTVGRVLSLPELALQPFDAGALVRTEAGWRPFANPFLHPGDVPSSLAAGLVGPTDAVAIARLSAEALMGWGEPGERTAAYLRRLGCTERLVARFLRPFFAGIWLDRTLDVDASVFRFYWRMLLQGRAAVPAAGMQALPDQLAARLPAGSLRLGAPVAALQRTEGHVTGVVLASGERLEAAHVVLAASPPEVARLLDEAPVVQGKAALTLYFAATRPPFDRRLIALAPDPTSPVGIVAVPSRVAPGYAPPGEHQVAIQVLPVEGQGPVLEPDEAQRIVAGWFPAAAGWRFLEAVAVPFGQYGQAPGSARLAVRHPAGVVVASEATRQSSIEGAVAAGLAAAEALGAPRL
ncbi:MAG: NAD(P)/FAD-dependent oxidoreductase [Candidatus Sericytochromatia bacterium]|nr:NAD(P)/FAD-dependent oxidoreductase [Candidatus Sericytochromatia bacterium]